MNETEIRIDWSDEGGHVGAVVRVDADDDNYIPGRNLGLSEGRELFTVTEIDGKFRLTGPDRIVAEYNIHVTPHPGDDDSLIDIFDSLDEAKKCAEFLANNYPHLLPGGEGW